jgi:hypothetical protein
MRGARDVRLIRSPISVAGMVLTTITGVVFVVVFLGDLFGLHTNPYLSILFFVLLPALFALGLVLIPFGAWVERRRRAAGRAPSSVEWPRIDLNTPAHRRTAVVIFALTMANVVIVSLATYKGVAYMDSPAFCGQVCHTPMQPQFITHLEGPHARVACVECHVGPTAGSAVRAKLVGVRRLVAVGRDSYPRPIVAAREDLIGSRDTCEHCHVPARFRGDVTRRISEYADNEDNTESVTTIRLHVGGTDRVSRTTTGIHWHADPATVVEYIATDDRRQTIPWVRVTDARGAVREYAVGNVTPDQLPGERRRMECTDCHNRPAHPIAATPERAVDSSIARGEIPVTLPFVRREAVKTLKASYPSDSAALDAISRSLRDFYKTQNGGSARAAQDVEIERAILATQNIRRRSVFPDMKVTFGTYPNNTGHIDAPGCFRCHDDEHVAKDGKTIGQDCETCHAIE